MEQPPYTLKRQKTNVGNGKRKRIELKHGSKGKINENIKYHGNCLSLIPCLCKSCLHVMKQTVDECNNNCKVDPNVFVLHPTGECLSSSCLIMPQGLERIPGDAKHDDIDIHVDVGGKILQIDNCFDVSQKNDFAGTDSWENFEWWILVRTAYHCSVVVCKLLDIVQKQKNKASQKLRCSGIYGLTEVR